MMRTVTTTREDNIEDGENEDSGEDEKNEDGEGDNFKYNYDVDYNDDECE